MCVCVCVWGLSPPAPPAAKQETHVNPMGTRRILWDPLGFVGTHEADPMGPRGLIPFEFCCCVFGCVARVDHQPTAPAPKMVMAEPAPAPAAAPKRAKALPKTIQNRPIMHRPIVRCTKQLRDVSSYVKKLALYTLACLRSKEECPLYDVQEEYRHSKGGRREVLLIHRCRRVGTFW